MSKTLQQEGETVLAELHASVDDAERALLALLERESSRMWTIRELQDAAAEGRSPTAMSLAFLRLVKRGVVQVGDDMRVHFVR
jgi:predicted transcriptional regulator